MRIRDKLIFLHYIGSYIPLEYGTSNTVFLHIHNYVRALPNSLLANSICLTFQLHIHSTPIYMIICWLFSTELTNADKKTLKELLYLPTAFLCCILHVSGPSWTNLLFSAARSRFYGNSQQHSVWVKVTLSLEVSQTLKSWAIGCCAFSMAE